MPCNVGRYFLLDFQLVSDNLHVLVDKMNKRLDQIILPEDI